MTTIADRQQDQSEDSGNVGSYTANRGVSL